MNDITGIPGFCFTKTKVITKGLSGDRKFYLETENRERFLARITECTKYEQKRAVYELLQEVSKIGIPMPMPIEFGYCENKNEKISFDGSSQILDYLETNKCLLANRPQTFHHGDFHLGNMVIGKNGQFGVLDWDTADFENNIPDEFWKLFAFYIAGSAITSIVWAKYFAPKYMAEIMKLNMDIVRWHNEMRNPIPIWYDKDLKYCDA